MKYPSIILQEEGASGTVISIAVARKNQHQDSGGKIIHLAPRTKSTIIAKSISSGGGRTSYRGLVKIVKGATGADARVQCDALLCDELSRTDTYPTVDIKEQKSHFSHEASVKKLDTETIFYLNSRGITPQEARAFVVNGFIDVFTSQLPMEYAVEINRLIKLEIEGSVG
jgi:Fe-S cluster assembly protein SufB